MVGVNDEDPDHFRGRRHRDRHPRLARQRATSRRSCYTPLTGDLSYYAPSGNLAIFHKDFSHSTGLVRLGRLDSGVDSISRPDAIQVRIERLLRQ
ncbi:cyclophilin-like fold protein [Variovorax boronicumulans]|uniref:cyclophilin-like fold protein n=1 Tax=Variovorax boronicumulans TaxID=436515 RepID=UPI0015550AEE